MDMDQNEVPQEFTMNHMVDTKHGSCGRCGQVWNFDPYPLVMTNSSTIENGHRIATEIVDDSHRV